MDSLLFGPSGKPRISVMSIAHLGDAERMFFVTLLLTELIAWMRRQPGSGSLRAILYMDEIFGYMPPVANPPSKTLFLTLLKQARAYGLGLVLATQNPVDLDYKGLSNTGHLVHRTAADRDATRPACATACWARMAPIGSIPRTLETTLSGLGKRRFLLHNVHEQRPVLFETRWVMSYLAGPLTRDQIKLLSSNQPLSAGAPEATAAPATANRSSGPRPVLPPGIREAYLPASRAPATGEHLVYYPTLLAAARMRYQNARLKVSERADLLLAAEPDDATGDVDWAEASPLPLTSDELDSRPDPDASYADLPTCLGRSAQYKVWDKSLKSHLRTERPLILYKSETLKTVSASGESEREFRIRLQQLGNEKRDLQVAKLRERYEKQVGTLEDRLRRAEQALERQSEQAKGQKLDAALSFGTAVLGALLGRKRISTTSASRVGTAVRKAGRVGQESADVRRAEETVAAVQEKLSALQAKFDDDVAALDAAYDAQAEELTETRVNPRATDVQIGLLALGWMPYLEDSEGALTPAWSGGQI